MIPSPIIDADSADYNERGVAFCAPMLTEFSAYADCSAGNSFASAMKKGLK